MLDLLKLENDLVYIRSPVADERGQRAAVSITDRPLAVEDLTAALLVVWSLNPALN